jgi:hypothetical protein
MVAGGAAPEELGGGKPQGVAFACGSATQVHVGELNYTGWRHHGIIARKGMIQASKYMQ